MQKETPSVAEISVDRFKNLSENYGNLFIEVFHEIGMDYEAFEKSVFDAVSAIDHNFKNKAILDIGIGDGETIKHFEKAGCNNLTGLDLNTQMLKQAKEKFGNSVKLVQADARELPFQPEDFPIIISGEAIHNIPKNERKKVWNEILRLRPEIFINSDKMVAATEAEHQKCYANEMAAIKKIFADKYGLEKSYQEWVKHYENDDKERLYPEEVQEFLGEDYDIKITSEMGMLKTLVATRKNK
jgi:ubiquinone/menaquinone biosynthesis C-methylase UbiE